MRLRSCRESTVLFRCALRDRYFETWVSFPFFTLSKSYLSENDAAIFSFRGDECFQLGDMLCVEPAAYRKNHFLVFRPVNSEHFCSSKEDLAYREGRFRSNRKYLKLKALLNLVVYETSSIYEVRRNFS